MTRSSAKPRARAKRRPVSSKAALRPSKIRSSLPPTWLTISSGRPYFRAIWLSIRSRRACFSTVERRGREVDDRLRAFAGQHLDRVVVVAAALPEVAVVPDVLADADAELPAVEFEHSGLGGGLEIPVLVENVVGGQEGFVKGLAHGAAAQQHGAVEQGPSHFGGVRRRDSDQHRRSILQFPGDAAQLLAALAHEAAAHQEIARQIAHQRELRGDDEIGALLARAFHAVDNEGGIAADIAGRRIDLQKCDSQAENPV